MIIALVTALLLVSGGGAAGYLYDLNALEKNVKTEVTDPDRKSAAVDVVKQMQDLDKNYRKSLSDFADDLAARDPDAILTEQQVNEVVAPFAEEVEAYQQGVIDKRFELRDQVNREEWAGLFPPDRS